jgi:acetate kinase
MAGTFGSNPQVAGQMSRELATVRSEMMSMGRTFDGFDGATGSGRIEAALDNFFSKTSDNRKKMNDLLERASGLLAGLAEGTMAVDKGLADALPEPTPAEAAR